MTNAEEVECLYCEDSGYEPGMPGYYCTWCKTGARIAADQRANGIDPFDPHGEDYDRRHDLDVQDDES